MTATGSGAAAKVIGDAVRIGIGVAGAKAKLPLPKWRAILGEQDRR